MKKTDPAYKAAENYLRNILADRRGCDVIGELDDDIADELIQELAHEFIKFKEWTK